MRTFNNILWTVVHIITAIVFFPALLITIYFHIKENKLRDKELEKKKKND